MQPTQNGGYGVQYHHGVQYHQYSVGNTHAIRGKAPTLETPPNLPQMGPSIQVVPVGALRDLRQEFNQGLAQIEEYRSQQAKQQGERIDSLEYKIGHLQQKVESSFQVAFSRIQALEKTDKSDKGYMKSRFRELAIENQKLRARMNALDYRIRQLENYRIEQLEKRSDKPQGAAEDSK